MRLRLLQLSCVGLLLALLFSSPTARAQPNWYNYNACKQAVSAGFQDCLRFNATVDHGARYAVCAGNWKLDMGNCWAGYKLELDKQGLIINPTPGKSRGPLGRISSSPLPPISRGPLYPSRPAISSARIRPAAIPSRSITLRRTVARPRPYKKLTASHRRPAQKTPHRPSNKLIRDPAR